MRVIKYWLYILDVNHGRMLYQCYKYQYNKAERGQNCWALDIKNILFSFGFGHVWFAQGVSNKNVFFAIFKQRSIDIELQRFSCSVSSNSKLNYYYVFKEEIVCEKYLYVIPNLILRILFQN
jgi:hypothetical protein